MPRRLTLAAAVLAAAVSGCSDGGSATAPVVVVSGTESGTAWAISARRQAGGALCLELKAPGVVPDGSGGCEFSDAPTGGRYLSWDAPGGTQLVFGPVPAAATTVSVTGTGYRIAPVATVALPASAAHGRLFVARLPGRSSSATVEARDAAGRILAPQDF